MGLELRLVGAGGEGLSKEVFRALVLFHRQVAVAQSVVRTGEFVPLKRLPVAVAGRLVEAFLLILVGKLEEDLRFALALFDA